MELSIEMGEDAGPGLNAHHGSRGCAFGDFDNDGDLRRAHHESAMSRRLFLRNEAPPAITG